MYSISLIRGFSRFIPGYVNYKASFKLLMPFESAFLDSSSFKYNDYKKKMENMFKLKMPALPKLGAATVTGYRLVSLLAFSPPVESYKKSKFG